MKHLEVIDNIKRDFKKLKTLIKWQQDEVIKEIFLNFRVPIRLNFDEVNLVLKDVQNKNQRFWYLFILQN